MGESGLSDGREREPVAAGLFLPSEVVLELLDAGLVATGDGGRTRDVGVSPSDVAEVVVYVTGAAATLVTLTMEGREALTKLAEAVASWRRRMIRPPRDSEPYVLRVRQGRKFVSMTLDEQPDPEVIAALLRDAFSADPGPPRSDLPE